MLDIDAIGVLQAIQAYKKHAERHKKTHIDCVNNIIDIVFGTFGIKLEVQHTDCVGKIEGD
jgi:hypothetical protein